MRKTKLAELEKINIHISTSSEILHRTVRAIYISLSQAVSINLRIRIAVYQSNPIQPNESVVAFLCVCGQ